MANIPNFLGIDISTGSFKIAEIHGDGKKRKLENVFYYPTKANLFEMNSNMDENVRELSEAYKQSKLKTKNCVISISENFVFSRLLTLPQINEQEEQETIHWSLKPLIPVEIEEVNVTYLKIDERDVNGQLMTDWYVVAAKKDLIERLTITFEKAGLNLLAIETEALALARLVHFSNPLSKDIVIIDIGAESTNVILSRRGIVLFSQTIATGGNSMTKLIAGDYSLDIVEAEKYKRAYGLDINAGEGKIAKSIIPVVDSIASEVGRAYSYFRERLPGTSISDIVLTGGASEMIGLKDYLKEKLSLEILLCNPVENLNLSGSAKKLFMNEAINTNNFNVAFGLALKRDS